MAWPTRYLSSHRPLPGTLGWSSRHLIAEQPDWVVELADRRQHYRSGDQWGVLAQAKTEGTESGYSSTSEVSVTQFKLRSEEDDVSQSYSVDQEERCEQTKSSLVTQQQNDGPSQENHRLCDGRCWPEQAINSQLQLSEISEAGITGLPRYIYKPLETADVRLLQLLPGSRGEQLRGILVNSMIPKIRPNPAIPRRDLDYPPTGYEALSYTWGQKGPQKTIYVADTGEASSMPLEVTPNLYLALQQLRSTEQKRTLWIDAICINQEDVQEKSRQVADMMRIYANADRVIVWLGASTETSDLALEAIARLDSREFRRKLVRESHSKPCIERLINIHNALSDLYSRPWFSRVWIWQEVMVARELVVLCGASQTTWRPLKRAAKRLRSLAAVVSKAHQGRLRKLSEPRLEMIRLLQNRWIFGLTISRLSSERDSVYEMHAGGPLELLMVSSMLEATDDRDKVYAFLGVGRVPVRPQGSSAMQSLGPSCGEANVMPSSIEVTGTNADDILHSFVPIDYSLTVSQVYQHFTKYMINKYRSFDILCLLNTFPSNSVTEPTWMLEWRRGSEECEDIMTHNWDYLSKTFHATGSSMAELQDPLAWGNLNASGVSIDTIEKLLDYTTNVFGMAAIHEVLLDSVGSPDEYGARVEDVMAETHKLIPENVRAYPMQSSSPRESRRCCKTSGGRVCLVPVWAEVGDELWILQGARLPFVLRWGYELTRQVHKASLREAVLEVVGPCFIPDFEDDEMYNDIVNGLEDKAVRVVPITLV